MANITVKVRADRGEMGTHPKYGALKPGAEIPIAAEDFGEELFERPAPDWRSPHEVKDAERAAKLKQRVGGQEPPADAKKGKNTEVTDHA